MNRGKIHRPNGGGSDLGFTLIEMLVAIAVMAILASIVIVSVQSYRARARDLRRIADLRSIELALIQFRQKYGEYPRRADKAWNYPTDFETSFGAGGPDHSVDINSDYQDYDPLLPALLEFMDEVPVDPINHRVGTGPLAKQYYYTYLDDHNGELNFGACPKNAAYLYVGTLETPSLAGGQDLGDICNYSGLNNAYSRGYVVYLP